MGSRAVTRMLTAEPAKTYRVLEAYADGQLSSGVINMQTDAVVAGESIVLERWRAIGVQCISQYLRWTSALDDTLIRRGCADGLGGLDGRAADRADGPPVLFHDPDDRTSR